MSAVHSGANFPVEAATSIGGADTVEAVSLADVYDRGFFEELGAANPVYAEACAVIAAEIHRRFSPSTAVDWGCGAALHAAALAKLGTDVTAIDAVVVDDDLRAPGISVAIADITAPVGPPLVPERCDLSLCIDVLEHIAEVHADQVLHNVCRGAGVVILSCAPPHQGGHHHVNEQPRRYWIDKMAALGWHYDRRETGAMETALRGRRDRVPWTWMFHNLCVYRDAPTRGRRRQRA